MRCSQFVSLVGIQRGMYTAKNHPGSPLARNAAKFQAAKCVGGVDTDTHNIAGLDPIRIKALQGFVGD